MFHCKWPDPTKSREERDAYIKFVLPVAMMSNLVFASTQYGFNVWLLPVSLALYGEDATYSMRTSVVLLSFASQMLMGAAIMETMPAKLMSLPTRVACAASSILYPLGVVLSGVSLQYSRGRWAEIGLFLSQFLFCGIGLAVSWFSTQVKIVMWFREIGRPSVGSGLFGFFNGFWPALFSYWGTQLVKDLRDIHLSFYYTALVLFVISLPSVFLLHSPGEVPLMMANDNDPSDETSADVESGGSAEDTAAPEESQSLESNTSQSEATSPLLAQEPKRGESKAGLTEVASPLLPKSKFNRLPQVWVQSLVWFLTFIPGFSIKFTIAPVMSAVFGASQAMQAASSFIFLGCYAMARLFIGFVIGSRVKVNTVVRTATFVIPICFFFAGAIVKAGKTYKGWMWVFVVANIGVACCLGVEKVLLSLVSLANWGPNNMHQMLGKLVFMVSLAAVLGPIFVWIGLSKPGDIYLDNTLNTSEQQQIELEQSMGVALLSLGASGVLAFLGHWFCVKPYNPTTAGVKADLDISEVSSVIATNDRINLLDSF